MSEQARDPVEPELKTERIQLLMSPSEVAAIDDWGFSNRVRTRAEAIRRLTQLGMAIDERGALLSGDLADALESLRKPRNNAAVAKILVRLMVAVQEISLIRRTYSDNKDETYVGTIRLIKALTDEFRARTEDASPLDTAEIYDDMFGHSTMDGHLKALQIKLNSE